MPYPELEVVKTAQQAERARKKLYGCWSKETQLSQRILIRCMELLENIEANTRPRRKLKQYKLSAWNVFFGNAIQKGMTPSEAAQAWKRERRKLA
jgi:hypothetical protein